MPEKSIPALIGSILPSGRTAPGQCVASLRKSKQDDGYRHARLDRALAPQLAALLTSLPIFSSTAALSLFKAKEVGQMSPSSRFAASWKPNVAYLDLNFCPLWKKQTTLPSLAYAGIPYQVFGESVGALALMTAWSRLAMPRSGSGISAIFVRRSLSPSASPERARLRSLRVSFIAARSSSESNLDSLVLVLRADFFLSLITIPPTAWTAERYARCRPLVTDDWRRQPPASSFDSGGHLRE